MQPPNQHSRINLAELKAQIVKKIGPEGSKQYLYYLNRFMSLKLNKVEFNKLCLGILGRENIPLHNQLIRSILRNACSAKTPPPVSSKDVSIDGYLQNGSHISTAQACGSPGLPNGGDMLPVSPRKARSGARDRKTGDRRSALGPNALASYDPMLSSGFNVMENGDMSQGLIQRAENENGISGPSHADVSALRRSQDGSAPVYSKDRLVRDDIKEASARSPLRAPLGVPLCPVSIGGAHRGLPSSRSRCIDDSLLDSLALREQMEQIAVAQGLEGVSVDCANILNHGLDSYLKGLIKSCMQLVGARSGHELTEKYNAHKQLTYMKPINGVKLGHQYQVQNSVKPLEVHHRQISLQDFRVAMELNPSQLGEDWPFEFGADWIKRRAFVMPMLWLILVYGLLIQFSEIFFNWKSPSSETIQMRRNAPNMVVSVVVLPLIQYAEGLFRLQKSSQASFGLQNFIYAVTVWSFEHIGKAQAQPVKVDGTYLTVEEDSLGTFISCPFGRQIWGLSNLPWIVISNWKGNVEIRKPWKIGLPLQLKLCHLLLHISSTIKITQCYEIFPSRLQDSSGTCLAWRSERISTTAKEMHSRHGSKIRSTPCSVILQGEEASKILSMLFSPLATSFRNSDTKSFLSSIPTSSCSFVKRMGNKVAQGNLSG
ncbi:hypothetical protein BUALT_Bualt02G0099900 [Buddleja alternifolia]|uniref:Transcriptional coactivator Hfi1/Transcriptional adapter 1 n=1 Tax=Buddleja alternifolia TaxID=168488 RepID=A0AAV6Y607_9LAMI|nr:hypothetical protein BUALT_Bualt02G0099900 [Buddleja alternifolia]